MKTLLLISLLLAGCATAPQNDPAIFQPQGTRAFPAPGDYGHLIGDTGNAFPTIQRPAQAAPAPYVVPHAQYLPDPKLSPGVACPGVTVEMLRSPQFIRNARTSGTADGKRITEAVKKQVYAEYGITARKPGEYEVDHIISLELGGSNDIRNLWPQPYSHPGAHEKDALENELHRRVVSGVMSLAYAQREIARDWVALYGAIFPDRVTADGLPRPAARQPNAEPDDAP